MIPPVSSDALQSVVKTKAEVQSEGVRAKANDQRRFKDLLETFAAKKLKPLHAKQEFDKLKTDVLDSLQPLRADEELDALDSKGVKDPNALQEAFQDFVGQTFFAQMIKALRSTEQESAYMNGGRAEKIFRGQFDQVLTEELSKSSAKQIAEPMYELFMLPPPK